MAPTTGGWSVVRSRWSAGSATGAETSRGRTVRTRESTDELVARVGDSALVESSSSSRAVFMLSAWRPDEFVSTPSARSAASARCRRGSRSSCGGWRCRGPGPQGRRRFRNAARCSDDVRRSAPAPAGCPAPGPTTGSRTDWRAPVDPEVGPTLVLGVPRDREPVGRALEPCG